MSLNSYVLRNGIRVVMEPLHAFRSVAFGIWVKTGSRNETPETNGVSHMIEHMLFKGTPRFSAREIAETFDGIGGHVNAFTSKEYTCYYAKVLDQHIATAIELLSEMFFHSAFDPEELEKERNVILEEISMYEDTPDDAVHDLITQAAYGDHPLGYPIIGSRENVRRFQSDDLKSYLSKWYSAEDLVLSVAGNVSEDVLSLIERFFGEISLQGSKETISKPTVRSNILTIEKKTEQTHLCLALPGLPYGHPDMFAMTALTGVLGGGMSSRLFQEVREKRGLAYSVYAYHSPSIDSGLFTIYTGTAPAQTEQVIDVIVDVMRQVVREGLSAEELNRSKEQMKGSFILGLESTNARMNRIAKNELLGLKQLSVDEVLQRIDAVSLQNVSTIIDQCFRNPFAVAWVGSQKLPEGQVAWKGGEWFV